MAESAMVLNERDKMTATLLIGAAALGAFMLTRHAGATPPPPGQCPPFTTGTPPDCVALPACPDFYTGTPPNCVPLITCPQFYIGTPPNCLPFGECPTGYTGTPPNCTPTPVHYTSLYMLTPGITVHGTAVTFIVGVVADGQYDALNVVLEATIPASMLVILSWTTSPNWTISADGTTLQTVPIPVLAARTPIYIAFTAVTPVYAGQVPVTVGVAADNATVTQKAVVVNLG